MKNIVLSRIRGNVRHEWKWMLGFFGSLIFLFLLAMCFRPNGKPANINALQEGVLVAQNPDEGWALFQDKSGPVLIETHDRTLVVGKTYEVGSKTQYFKTNITNFWLQEKK